MHSAFAHKTERKTSNFCMGLWRAHGLKIAGTCMKCESLNMRLKIDPL